MSHNYLLDLSEHLDARISALTGDTIKAAATAEEQCHSEGRIAALQEFQTMLRRDFYPKLPKRLYRRLATDACEGCLHTLDGCTAAKHDG